MFHCFQCSWQSCVIFFVICFVVLSDLATKSTSSQTTSCERPSVWIFGQPNGAVPLPGTLKVCRDTAGGLTAMEPPCLVLLLATVPFPNLCICFCQVVGVQLRDLFRVFVKAIIALFILGSCKFVW